MRRVSLTHRREITYITPGKLRCVITDRLRNDTLEENGLQRVARSLIDDYEYSREDDVTPATKWNPS